MQLHMVPKYISTLEAELPDSLYGLAKSVTLLEIADVPHEGLVFLWVFTCFVLFCLFFSFFLKNHRKYLAISQGFCFRNCTENTYRVGFFSVIEPVLSETLEKATLQKLK